MGHFKVLRIFVWIVFGLSALIYSGLTMEYDRILIFKEPLWNKALEGHLIRTEKAVNEGSCRLKCYLEPNCVSVNVGPFDGGSHISELNNDTDDSHSHRALVERQLYTYHAFENSCHCKPCPGKYALCQSGFTDKGFRCDCREGYRGERCKRDFIPGEGSLCGSCYKVFTVKETWNNANAKCKTLGAELVKIESAEENDFLRRTFLKAPTGTYWIGLTDQEEEGKWIWTDRSLLGDYSNWVKTNPNNLGNGQHCGHMVKGTDFQLQGYTFQNFNGEWNDFECHKQLEYICEQLSP